MTSPLLYVLGGLALLLVLLAVFTRRTARRIEAYLPPSGSFVEVEGVRLHVRDEGRGPALLMIHGLGGQMAHFNYGAVRELSQRYRVVTLDRPGSGYSTRPEGVPADLATQARAIARLIDKLGLERPTVVGHSLGGATALTLALDHPGQVGALALVAPLTHAPGTVPSAFRALTIETGWLRRLFAATLAVPLSIVASKGVLAEVFGPEPVPRDFPTRGGGLLSLRPGQFLASSADLQALGGHMPQLEQRYAALRVPLHILFGREDRLLDWRANGQALADKVAGARLELVDGGHMLPVTQPELTARFIEEAASTRLALAG
ncbi:alpha/beta fold hydrolase [Massilia sp. IC2-477]|uniref:alpha/beta fold hydrolase n=1 Tax=Massilia sp. IC2-477 TaxID=2887198 RepID=UPI001D1278B0|nr:alpha/beta fold hydrolase [Massilia sp. IC2-477]MCC2957496.1 alpha/beta fold hydrolase [Massilia sp. IC2-477]